MKIRIQDNSIRFRLTLREVEKLAVERRLVRQCEIPGSKETQGAFGYAIHVADAASQSRVVLEGASISLHLRPADLATLLLPDQEGVYLREEWETSDGMTHRFMAFVEKDRPGSTCVKKEQWIYDAPAHGPVETRPIPAKVKPSH